jgi:EpsI family protein
MASRMIVLVVMFLAAAASIARISRPEVVPIRASLAGMPIQIGSWSGQEAPPLTQRVLSILGVDDYVNRIYYGPGRAALLLYIGYYQSQREGDSIHSPMNCLPGAGWNPDKRGRIAIPVTIESGDARVDSAIEVNRIVVSKSMDKQLVYYWYQSHGRVVASEYWGKVYTMLDALRSNRTDAALVRVVCPVPGLDQTAEAAAQERAVDFIKSLFPLLNRFLPQ